MKSTIRERGSLKVIDKVTVSLNEKRDVYEALLETWGSKASRSAAPPSRSSRNSWSAASGASPPWNTSTRRTRRARRSSSGT